jgi:hypothetical protein
VGLRPLGRWALRSHGRIPRAVIQIVEPNCVAGAQMIARDRKRSALQQFRDGVKNLAIGDASTAKPGGVEAFVKDGTKAVIKMLTIRGGLGTGEFAAYSDVGIYGGTVFDALKAVRLDGGSTYPTNLLVAGTSHALVPSLRRGAYAFRSSANVTKIVGRMIADVRKNYVPIIEAFGGNYGRALDFILTTNGAHVRKPFGMSLVLLGLTHSFGQVQRVIKQAKRSQQFWDYHKTKDPHALVERVRDWFDRRKGSA